MDCKKHLISLACILLVLPFAFALTPTFDGTIGLSCQKKPNFNINEKEFCVGEIPVNFSGEEFKCLSYVKLGNETKQTNPMYKDRSDSLIAGFWNDVEKREYFTSSNLVVNFYYTKKNLLPNYNYTIGLSCNSPSYSLNGETDVMIDYENLDFLFSRMQWGGRNAGYIIGGILLAIVLIGAIGIIWWMAK